MAAAWAALYALAAGWAESFQVRVALVALVGAYPLNLTGTFFGVAFLAVADGRVRGEGTSIAEGLRVARGKLGVIARWALLASGVGLVLQALQQVKSDWLATPLLSWLAGAAWTVLTFFVLPVLAFEEVGVRESVRRSGRIVRARWGEGLSGATNIGLVGVVVGSVIGAVAAVAGTVGFLIEPAVGVAVWVLVGVLFFGLIGVVTAISQLFSLTLYRFATGHETLGDFTAEELQVAFRKKRKRRLWRRDS